VFTLGFSRIGQVEPPAEGCRRPRRTVPSRDES
jgi:hypothetical protein